MAYEERRVVTDEPAVVETPAEPVYAEPTTVVERRPQRTVIANNDDVVGNAWAASQLIQTIVWSVVVLVLLVVAIMALHVYAHLF